MIVLACKDSKDNAGLVKSVLDLPIWGNENHFRNATDLLDSMLGWFKTVVFQEKLVGEKSTKLHQLILNGEVEEVEKLLSKGGGKEFL